MKKWKYIAVLLSLCGVAQAGDRWQQDVVKQGKYRSLGYYTGYYHYGEVDEVGADVMRMDTAMFGLVGQLGRITDSGLKMEGTARINYALGLYTGSILDVDDKDRHGQALYGLTGAIVGDVELKLGYDLLRLLGTSSSLLLQGGLGYHLNRTEFLVTRRIQGYFYIPIELEGAAALSSNVALEYGGGYRYLIMGNHYTEGSQYGFTDDLRTNQKQGYGLSAFLGASFMTKDSGLRSVRLVYEYWDIGPSDGVRTSSIYTGKLTGLYEPKNSTHRLFLQYSFAF